MENTQTAQNGYIITDSKGPDYYNDGAIYDSLESAEVALAEAQAWARDEAKREPSWADAQLRIEEVCAACGTVPALRGFGRSAGQVAAYARIGNGLFVRTGRRK